MASAIIIRKRPKAWHVSTWHGWLSSRANVVGSPRTNSSLRDFSRGYLRIGGPSGYEIDVIAAGLVGGLIARIFRQRSWTREIRTSRDSIFGVSRCFSVGHGSFSAKKEQEGQRYGILFSSPCV